jgi:DNA-binding NarL/FixJ family response regulator
MSHSAMVSQACARVLIVDDHPTVREGLGRRIGSQPDFEVCGEAADARSALAEYVRLQPDAVIVDLALKDGSGLELIKDLRARYSGARTLVHSMYDERIYADRCLRAGAMGYVNKEADPDVVISALRAVMNGRVFLSDEMTSRILNRTCKANQPFADPVETLTDRQLEVFRLIGEGYGSRQISERLHLSIHTVETHRENIKQKLDIDSTAELSRRAVLWASRNV